MRNTKYYRLLQIWNKRLCFCAHPSVAINDHTTHLYMRLTNRPSGTRRAVTNTLTVAMVMQIRRPPCRIVF